MAYYALIQGYYKSTFHPLLPPAKVGFTNVAKPSSIVCRFEAAIQGIAKSMTTFVMAVESKLESNIRHSIRHEDIGNVGRIQAGTQNKA